MESEAGVVRIEDHSPEMVSKMLEFIYTNRVMDMSKLNSNVRGAVALVRLLVIECSLILFWVLSRCSNSSIC